MNIQSICGFTNPCGIKQNLAKNKFISEPKTLITQKTNADTFVKNQDGKYISNTINPTTGELMMNISKINWNKEGMLESTETTSVSVNNPKIGIKTIKDYEHNSESMSVITNPLNDDKVNKTLVTVRKDPITGKTIAKETYKMSDVQGIYNVTETDALGRTKVISSAHKNKDGSIYISKNMTSLDGTTTTYRYFKDANGNHIRMYNQIADKNGKVLSTIDRTYDKVNKNLAYSSINGHKYTIEQQGKNTIITDHFNNEKTILNKKSFQVPFYEKNKINNLGKLQGYTPEQTKEPVINELLHKLPGDVLIDMNKDVQYIIPLKNNQDSAFMACPGILYCNTDEFVVSHELGHSKDSYLPNEYKDNPKSLQNPIADNPEFKKEYFNERAMFLKAFPEFKKEYIDYFIFPIKLGRRETVAETNAINSQSPVPAEIFAMRTQILQQYFPRTIAVTTKLTTPIAIADNKNIILPSK